MPRLNWDKHDESYYTAHDVRDRTVVVHNVEGRWWTVYYFDDSPSYFGPFVDLGDAKHAAEIRAPMSQADLDSIRREVDRYAYD